MKSYNSIPLLIHRAVYVFGVSLYLVGASADAREDTARDVRVSVFEFEPNGSTLSPNKAIEHQDALMSAANAFIMFAGRSDVDMIFKVSSALDGVDDQRLIDARLGWFVEYLSHAPAGGMFIEHDEALKRNQAVLSLRPASQPSNLCPWWMTIKTGVGQSSTEVTLPAGYSGVLPLIPEATVSFSPAFDPPYHLAARVNDTGAIDATGRLVAAPAVIRLAVAVEPIDPMALRDAEEDDARNIALSQKVALDAPLLCTVKLIEGGLGEAIVSDE